MSFGPKDVAVVLACFCFASSASAAEMTANKPGVMCETPSALGQLTLPSGDSRTHRLGPSPADVVAARQGGCVDIQLGMQVTIIERKLNTSIVRFTDSAGIMRTMVAPNVDFLFSDGGTPQAGSSTGQVHQDVAAAASAVSASGTLDDLLRSPKFTDVIAALAYGKLTGVAPDFRAYAQRSAPYQAASAFQKEAVLQHLTSGYKTQFDALSLTDVYSMRVSSELNQYESEQGGYPTDFKDSNFVPLQDPVNSIGYRIQFVNISSFNFLPMPSADAAQDFAAKYNLGTHGSSAASIFLEFAFQMVDAPPAVDAQSAVIRARIIAGQIRSRTGQILYRFPMNRGETATSAGSVGTTMGPHVEALRSALIQQIGVGTPETEAIATARGNFPNASSDETPTYDSYFNNLKGTAKGKFCGGLGTNTASVDAMMVAGFTSNHVEVAGSFSDCLSFAVSDGVVTEVHSAQFQAGITREALVQALIVHYGPPTYNSSNDKVSYYQWIGTDTQGRVIEIDGTVVPQDSVMLFKVDAKPWKDPHPQKPSVPVATGPKL